MKLRYDHLPQVSPTIQSIFLSTVSSEVKVDRRAHQADSHRFHRQMWLHTRGKISSFEVIDSRAKRKSKTALSGTDKRRQMFAATTSMPTVTAPVLHRVPVVYNVCGVTRLPH